MPLSISRCMIDFDSPPFAFSLRKRLRGDRSDSTGRGRTSGLRIASRRLGFTSWSIVSARNSRMELTTDTSGMATIRSEPWSRQRFELTSNSVGKDRDRTNARTDRSAAALIASLARCVVAAPVTSAPFARAILRSLLAFATAWRLIPADDEAEDAC